MSSKFMLQLCVAATALLAVFFASPAVYGQGLYLTGVGPVNRSMGGAGTAAPLEAIGALYWNPGSISALPTNEVGFGMELLLPDVSMGTNVGGVKSQTSGEAGVSPIPTIGWVHHVDDSAWTVGLGMYGVAGFKNNLPTNPNNPFLTTRPAFAAADILQIAPTASYAVSDRFSIGFAPTITVGTLTLDPIGPPVIPAPLPGQGNRLSWGGGFQAGVYFLPTENWHLGFTYKSPQWFEDFRFFTPAGVAKFNLDMPMILSLGLSYTGIENWTFAVDARYFDYANTAGFDQLGWSNIFAGAIGVQYHATERTFLRAGYNFNQNPIHGSDVLTNIFVPLVQDQNVSAGVSYQIATNVDLNFAYVYLMKNSVTGSLPSPPFPAGSTVTHELSAHSAVAGLSVRY